MSNQQPPTKKMKIFSSESLVNSIPIEIWRDVIGTKLGYFDRSNGNATCKEFNDTFENYNQNFLKKHAIHVPQDAPTIEKAMELVAKLQLVPTEKDPLRIVLDEGVHEIFGYTDEYGHWKELRVTCSHITFVGKGKDQTTIRGRVKVTNQQHVTFEDLTVINPSGDGFYLVGSETNVDLLKCIVKECGDSGIDMSYGVTVTATQCEFMENNNGVTCSDGTKATLTDCQIHHNGVHGVQVGKDSVMDIHGEKTDIHANKGTCIRASYFGKVNIHLPCIRTVGDSQKQVTGASIANMNADGTFTHVVAYDDDWTEILDAEGWWSDDE